MNTHSPTLKNAIALPLLLAGSLAFAGPQESSKNPITPAPQNAGDWCSWLQSSPGTIYKSDTNPFIQEVGVFGRFQYQYAIVDGKSPGSDFHYNNNGEIRRFRLGGRVKFLNYFHLWGNADMEDDRRPEGFAREIEYTDIWEAQLLFNAKKAFGIENHSAFIVGYGKAELQLSEEVNTSSKKIKTIERSAIANKIFPLPNLTGAWVDAKTGKFSYYLGIFSTDSDTEIGNWDNGTLYTTRLAYDLTDTFGSDSAEALFYAAYSDNENAADDLVGFDWVASAALRVTQGPITYRGNLIYGENRDDSTANRDGSFFGAVFLPTYWIAQDRLEAVFRYQYQHAEEDQGIRLNSRYARRAGGTRNENIPSLASGRGDEHHNLYLGLNYYLCGDNSKIMAGVEWDHLESDNDSVYQGFTYAVAYRMYF